MTILYTMPTALVIGRFQPFHEGHQVLIARAATKYGQVLIGVRTMPQSSDNPYSFLEVRGAIKEWLKAARLDQVCDVCMMPNVVSVVHGRTPGWTVDAIRFADEIENVSATKIRAVEQAKAAAAQKVDGLLPHGNDPV